MERLVVKARPSVGPLPPSLDSYDLIGVTTQASLFFFSLFFPLHHTQKYSELRKRLQR